MGEIQAIPAKRKLPRIQGIAATLAYPIDVSSLNSSIGSGPGQQHGGHNPKIQ